jgi:hypothetical protein
MYQDLAVAAAASAALAATLGRLMTIKFSWWGRAGRSMGYEVTQWG